MTRENNWIIYLISLSLCKDCLIFPLEESNYFGWETLVLLEGDGRHNCRCGMLKLGSFDTSSYIPSSGLETVGADGKVTS